MMMAVLEGEPFAGVFGQKSEQPSTSFFLGISFLPCAVWFWLCGRGSDDRPVIANRSGVLPDDRLTEVLRCAPDRRGARGGPGHAT